MGLNATLARYVEEFQASHDLIVELAVPADELPIDDRAQISIFRILQEGLQNIQKHAAAARAWIELVCLPDGSVSLTVRDDGQGFDPSGQKPTARSGAGLLGMRERAALLGGTLTVASTPGRGTTITLHLPSMLNRLADSDQADVVGAKQPDSGRRKR
jgi:signal transduction histidine kinase